MKCFQNAIKGPNDGILYTHTHTQVIFEKQNQTGRSMIEMLGVLAVIGVLSVGGILGYTSAMNRHKANELIHEVQKRAMTVVAQAMNNMDSYSMDEFTNPTGYLFDVKNWNDTQFAITLTQTDGSNIDNSICQEIKNTVGTQSPIREVRQNCTHFIFNKDLSIKETGDISCTTDSQCDGCQKCQNGFCVNKCKEDEFCGQGSSTTDYICQSVPDICTACTKNEWCNIKGTDSTSKVCTFPVEASCEPIESPEVFNTRARTIVTTVGENIKIYRGPDTGTWWAAKNFCEAHGKKIASLSGLGIKKIKCSTQNCRTIEGNPIPDSFWDEIDRQGIPYYAWMAESNDSCLAFAIRRYSRDITAWYRLFKNYAVLCE